MPTGTKVFVRTDVWDHVRRRLGGLEESLSADLALNAHGFLVLDKNLGQRLE